MKCISPKNIVLQFGDQSQFQTQFKQRVGYCFACVATSPSKFWGIAVHVLGHHEMESEQPLHVVGCSAPRNFHCQVITMNLHLQHHSYSFFHCFSKIATMKLQTMEVEPFEKGIEHFRSLLNSR
jgi:hypothetical protein